MIAIGLDLCRDYTAVHTDGREEATLLPTAICRDKDGEFFAVGEDAYRRTLRGDGILVDRLLRLVERGGSATLGGSVYEAQDLLNIFFEQALRRALSSGRNPADTDALTVTVTECTDALRTAIGRACDAVGIPAEKRRIISHSEAMMCYVLRADSELYHNTAALYSLTEDGLFYHEMQVTRGVQRTSAAGDGARLDDSFNLDILKNEAGRKLADSILRSCAEKLMQHKTYSSVFLTGKGFEDTSFFPKFLEYVCMRRRVLHEDGLFARGASAASADRLREETAYPYLFLCDTRLPSDVGIQVLTGRREETVLLAQAGTPFEEAGAELTIVPIRQDYIEISVSPANRREKRRSLRFPLTGFPERPDRCTKVRVSASFPQAGKMRLCLRDLGFGEIFPASGACITEEVNLS